MVKPLTRIYGLLSFRKLETARLRLQELLFRADLRQDVSFLVVAGIVGVCAGYGAVVFRGSIDLVQSVMFGTLAKVSAGAGWGLYLIPLLPAFGGLLLGWFTHRFSREARGHGVPDVMKAVIVNDGRIHPMMVVNKIVASAVSIGSGGGGGREGPIVQIGAAIGSALGQVFRLSTERMRLLVGCGAAGGIAAIFNAPLGGVMFAIEIILGEFSVRAFSPIVISSVLATAVSRSILGNNPTFESPAYTLSSNVELIFYFVIGVCAGPVSVWFTRTVYWCEDRFTAWKTIPTYLKPMVGGLMTGILLIWWPGLSGFSYDSINNAIAGNEELFVLAGVFLLKPLAAGLTLGSGGSGGVFTPALKTGAMMGALIGVAFHSLFPDQVPGFGGYALVGMGALVAGTMHAPLTAILMLFEVTNSYQIILPIMIAAITATVIARRYLPQSVYTIALEREGVRVGYGVNLNVIQNVRVRDVMRRVPAKLKESQTLRSVVATIGKNGHTVLPVVDEGGGFRGVVTFTDISAVVSDQHASDFLLVKDIMQEEVLTLEEGSSLEDALKAFELSDLDIIPVVKARGTRTFVGMVSHESVLNRYRKDILTSRE